MSHLFDRGSDVYASARPRYPAELYSFLASLCRETECAWDCACGNGQAALSLAAFFSRVHATDLSPNQIENAFANRNVQYLVCPSEKTPFADNTFDLVCVAQALHWMDFDRFWPEVVRVLKPGGIFSAWGYSWASIDAQLDAVISTSFLEVISPYWAEQNKLLWNHYRDVTLPFAPLATPTFEMKAHWSLHQFFAYLRTWSATKRCVDVLGEDFLSEAYSQVSAVWPDPEERREVKLDFGCVVGRNNPS